MKAYVAIIVIYLSVLLIGCSNKPRFSDSMINFENLPIDVRIKFKEVYNYCSRPYINGNDTIQYMPPFIEAYNMNGDSVIIDMSNNLFNNSFTIRSNGKCITLNLKILERVFIIKDDTIYYPVSGNGIVEYGEPRSSIVDVDTLMFQVSVMK